MLDSIDDARKKIVATFEELGLLDRIEETIYPGRSERSGVIVEPLIKELVHTKPLADRAIEAVERKTKIIPAVWKKPTTTSCTTSTNGVFLDSCGGDTKFQHGIVTIAETSRSAVKM